MIYSVVDIESTGGAFNEEGIIDIAILRYDGYELIDQFHSLVDPERPIQSFEANLPVSNPLWLKEPRNFIS